MINVWNRACYEQEALVADMIIKVKTKLWPEASAAQQLRQQEQNNNHCIVLISLTYRTKASFATNTKNNIKTCTYVLRNCASLLVAFKVTHAYHRSLLTEEYVLHVFIHFSDKETFCASGVQLKLKYSCDAVVMKNYKLELSLRVFYTVLVTFTVSRT